MYDTVRNVNHYNYSVILVVCIVYVHTLCVHLSIYYICVYILYTAILMSQKFLQFG